MRVAGALVVMFRGVLLVPPEVTMHGYKVLGKSPVTIAWCDVELAATPLSIAALAPAYRFVSADTSVVQVATMVVSVVVNVKAEIMGVLAPIS
jgi:hypothetical protein